MAIKKMSSQDFNDILKNATDKIQSVSEEMTTIKNDIQKKLAVIQYEQEYLGYQNSKIVSASPKEDSFLFLNTGKNDGLYEGFSNVVHAAYKNTPINIFNLRVSGGTKDYFRDEANVIINGIQDEYFKNILKADTIADKEIFFEEYKAKTAIKTQSEGSIIEEKQDRTIITIERNEANAIGTSSFNVIEIDPYLYRSFDFEKIEVFTDDSEKPAAVISDVKNVGKTRIILDKKYVFKKVVFTVAHNYSISKNGEKIHPFGIKHLFFLEADFRKDSYIVVPYHSEEYINDVDNSIQVTTATGTRMSTVDDEGIEIYLSYDYGMLSNPQEASTIIKKPIARNLKNIYFKIPLRMESIVGYNFTINTR